MSSQISEQLSIFPEQDRETECCYSCRHFAEYKSPVLFDGYRIDGCCFKSGGRGLQVYIAGARCKDYAPVKT